VEVALRHYTRDGAYASFDEDRRGTLSPGKLADLILIDRNVMKCPEDDIRETEVLLTMVGGKIVWESKGSASRR